MPNLELPYEERRDRNRKLREKVKQDKLNARGALKDPQVPIKENASAGETTKHVPKNTQNDPEPPRTDSKASNSSIHPKPHNESDSNKTASNDSDKANPSQLEIAKLR